MEKFKQYLLATAGLAILVGGLTLLGPAVPQGQAVPPAKDVNVINASLNVAATQSGPWNVGITNDDTNPIPVVLQNGGSDDPTLVEFTVEPTTTAPLVLFTVPDGKRVVITDIVITAGAGTGRVAIQRAGQAIPLLAVPAFALAAWLSGAFFLILAGTFVVALLAAQDWFRLPRLAVSITLSLLRVAAGVALLPALPPLWILIVSALAGSAAGATAALLIRSKVGHV